MGTGKDISQEKVTDWPEGLCDFIELEIKGNDKNKFKQTFNLSGFPLNVSAV